MLNYYYRIIYIIILFLTIYSNLKLNLDKRKKKSQFLFYKISQSLFPKISKI